MQAAWLTGDALHLEDTRVEKEHWHNGPKLHSFAIYFAYLWTSSLASLRFPFRKWNSQLFPLAASWETVRPGIQTNEPSSDVGIAQHGAAAAAIKGLPLGRT